MPQERPSRPLERSALLGLRHQHTGFRHSHAIVIGVNRYPRIKKDLLSAVPDAWEVARLLWEQQGFNHVWLFLNPRHQTLQKLLDWMKQPDRSPDFPLPPWREVRHAAESQAMQQHIARNFLKLGNRDRLVHMHHGLAFEGILAEGSTPEGPGQIGDSLVFYYAGHGQAGKYEEGPAGYLLPTDVGKGIPMKNRIPMEAVLAGLQALNCKHTLLILDCCFAGKFRHIATGSRLTESGDLRPLTRESFDRFLRKRAWQVLVSAGPDETAADWITLRDEHTEKPNRQNQYQLPHSPFAQGLFEAMSGKADLRGLGERMGDGVLTANELKAYLFDRVQRSTFQDPAFKEQHPDLFPMLAHDGGEFIFINPSHPQLQFAEWQHKNPYKGLRPFEQEDWPFFFGRKAAISALQHKTEKTKILLVSASSGQGKSSLIKAGLFPQWKKEGRQLYICRPTEKAGTDFAPILEKITGTNSQRQALLVDQYEELLWGQGEKPDQDAEREQFETALIELFKQNPTEAQGDLLVFITLRSDFEWAFFQSKVGKFLQAHPHFDHYRLPEMGLDEMREALLGPALIRGYDFEPSELENQILEEIISAPAALSLLSFTMKALFEKAESEIRTSAKDRRKLTQTHYMELGGVAGALSTRADEVFAQFTPVEQQAIEKLFLRMVQVNDGAFTRRKISQRQDFYEWDYPGQAFDTLRKRIVEQFTAAQLLVISPDSEGQSFVEPAHDALINHWSLCRQWIQDFGKENLLLQRQLWQAVLEVSRAPERPRIQTSDYRLSPQTAQTETHNVSAYWDSNPKLLQVINQVLAAGKPLLLSREDNDLLRAYRALPESKDFQAEKLREACRGTDYVMDMDSLILTGVSSLLLAVYLEHAPHWLNQAEVHFIQESWDRRAERTLRLKAERDKGISDSFIYQANLETDRSRAFKLAALAAAVQPHNPRVIEKLVNNYYFDTQACYGHLIGHQEKIVSLSFSADESRLASCCAAGVVRIWATDTRHEIFYLDRKAHSLKITALAFFPAGAFQHLLLLGHDNGTLAIWDPETGEITEGTPFSEPTVAPLPPATEAPIPIVPFAITVISMSATRFAVGTSTAAVFIGHFSSLAEPTWQPPEYLGRLSNQVEDFTQYLGFSPSSKYLVGNSRKGEEKIWSLAQKKSLPHPIEKDHRPLQSRFLAEEEGKLVLLSLQSSFVSFVEYYNLMHVTLTVDDAPISTRSKVLEWTRWGTLTSAFALDGSGNVLLHKKGAREEGQLCLYDLQDPQEPRLLSSLEVYDDGVDQLVSARSGVLFVSSADQGTLKIWTQPPTQAEADIEDAHLYHPHDMDLFQGPEKLVWGTSQKASAYKHSADEWDRPSLELEGKLAVLQHDNHAEMTVKVMDFPIWDQFPQLRTSATMVKLDAPNKERLFYLDYAPETQQFLGATLSGDIFLFDQEGKPLSEPGDYQTDHPPELVQFCHQGQSILALDCKRATSSGSNWFNQSSETPPDEKKGYLWEIGNMRPTYFDSPEPIDQIAMTPDQKYGIISFISGKTEIWDLLGKQRVEEGPPMAKYPIERNLLAHAPPPHHWIAIHPLGQQIAIAGPHTLHLVNFETGVWKTDQALVIRHGHREQVRKLLYSTDGSMLFSMEEKIKVWDTNTGASLMTFEGDGAPVYTAACLTNAPILMFGTPKHLYSIWLDAEKIVSLALAYRRMGALSPQEIKLFKLESQLQSLGWLDGAGNPTPLIASGDEEQMFNLALYYLEQSKDAFANRQTSLRRHAYQLLVAGRQIAVFHHHKTYDELLGSLYP